MSDQALAAEAAVPPARHRRALRFAREVGPGLALTGAIAAAAYALRSLPGVAVLSPMILAILVGIAVHNTVGTPSAARAGVAVAARPVLRFAIVLLGLQITAQQVVALGGAGVAVIAATLAATFLFTKAMGRLLGVERRLAELIAAGTSICGASAVIAANTVTEGSDEDVAYAVACVTLFGTVAMFTFPLLGTLAGLGPHAYGLWAGASIHEVAQVVAAAFQHGSEAGEVGTIAKLSRVMLLAPVVGLLGLVAIRRGGSPALQGGASGRAKAPPVPWFVLGFVALIGVNSLGLVPAVAKPALVTTTVVLLTMALGALGLHTDIRKLRAEGFRPLLLGALSSVFVAGFGLALVMFAG